MKNSRPYPAGGEVLLHILKSVTEYDIFAELTG